MLSFACPSVPYTPRPVSSAGMAPFKFPNYVNHHRPNELSAAVKRFSALRSPSHSSSSNHSIHQNGFNHKNDAHDDRLNSNYEKMDIRVMSSSSGSGGSSKGLQQNKVPNGVQDLHSGTEGKTSSSGYETCSSSSFFRRFVQTQQAVTHTPPEIRAQTEAQAVTLVQAESEPEPDTQNTVTENMDPRSYFSRSSASSRASDHSSNSCSSTQVNHVESGMKAFAITPGLNGLSKPIPKSFESNEGIHNGYATFAPDGSAVYVSGPASSSQAPEVHLEGKSSGKRSLILEREMKEVGVGSEPHVEQNCYWFGKAHPKLIQSYKKGDILRVHVANTILDPKHLFLVHDEDLTFDAKIKEMSEQMKAREEWQIRFREPPALDSVVCARCPSRSKLVL
ncbi:hypothetical protein RvY_17618-2 [Ramazzottius varieornatus]|uniref:Uncharacterized protein n=1 Tax=Ramazzottius varieornatus TaxID=947166 RepID=A0A1D1W9P3_RAMVA|nr:hypothetical protein RvY_17618-2 [Ramazzottius varieornatus]